jgi:hypothetical protein
MSRSRDTLTYRLRRLPTSLERCTVANFLVKYAKDLGPPDNIVVYSIALNSLHWERNKTKVATLMFKKTPDRFNNDQAEWTIPVADPTQSLIFDTHFLDFTSLSDPDPMQYQFE